MDRDYFSSGVIGAALILSIIIAWAAILAPSHAAPLVLGDAKSAGVAVSIISNTARKGDRLDVGRSKTEYGSHSAPAPAAEAGASIPVGCDLAFSKLVRSENTAVRCITSAETPVKFARAIDHDRAL